MHQAKATIVECVASGPIDGTAMRGKSAYCLINASMRVHTEYQEGALHVSRPSGLIELVHYNRVMECHIHSTETGQIHRVQAYIDYTVEPMDDTIVAFGPTDCNCPSCYPA